MDNPFCIRVYSLSIRGSTAFLNLFALIRRIGKVTAISKPMRTSIPCFVATHSDKRSPGRRRLAFTPLLVGMVLLALSAHAPLLAASNPPLPEPSVRPIIVASAPENDLFRLLKANGLKPKRFSEPAQAIAKAKPGSAVLLLADAYPTNTLPVSAELFAAASAKGLHLYVEFPSWVPGIPLGAPRKTAWERLVVSTEQFGAALPKGRILLANDCQVLPATAPDPALVVARVAGYHTAVYGIPASAQPILFSLEGGRVLVATTKLSGFVTGRFAPASEWARLWEHLLKDLSGAELAGWQGQPRVQTMYGPREKLPGNCEQVAFKNAARWVYDSRLLVSQARWPAVQQMLKDLKPQDEVFSVPGADAPPGDGRFGIFEGFASNIRHDGEQMVRKPLRADCQAESAMVLAMDWGLNRKAVSQTTASNLLDFVYYHSDLCGGPRGNPKHPAYGLIGWGSITPSWVVANYGDDNARVMLATMLAAACLQSDRWDEPLLRALHANLRTTGKLGFQGDRIDLPDLARNGWRHYHEAETVNYSPPFEALNWACYLWAYRQTGEREFLDKTKTAIRMTMAAFPDQWRWNDSTERARMLLCLAWLVRAEDTAEHRAWLHQMVQDVIRRQDETGAIPERFRGAKNSHFQIPKSNEAYGTTEGPLLQENGDPVTDQLYGSGFTLLGLHEAAAVLADPQVKRAEDKLAEYLCRIQIRSKALPYLNGNWFRAFDFQLWEPWASSGDSGWGAWCVEAGWAQAWTSGVLGLRLQHATLWDLTATSRIRAKLPAVLKQMAENSGGPN